MTVGAESKRNCRFNLLTDRPATADAFGRESGPGPHQRVADAIGEILESRTAIENRRGTTTLALEGGWGSGKSTVIQLVRTRFEARPNHLTVEFDAWAHEGDPLRRTFLETFVARLNEKKWISDETATRVADRISRRMKTTTTETNSRPTRLGFFSSLSILFIPLGTALIHRQFRKEQAIK